MKMTDAVSLTDTELVGAMARLAGREREATAALIVHLAEFDARQLWAAAGFSSTQRYCMHVLRLSEDAAYNRIHAARVCRRHPIALEMLLSGELSPTTARMLERHLTAENHRQVLAAAAGKSKQEVEELIARIDPQPDVADRVRLLPNPVGRERPPALTAAVAAPSVEPANPASMVPAARPVVRPLAPECYEIRFTGTARIRNKLREAQDLLAHAVPNGDIAEVFDRALTLLIADLRKKRFAAAERPRRTHPSRDEKYMPADVRRAVEVRDGGRCAYVSADGRRCDGARFLEFHHLVPRAVGGKATVANIQLRCRTHNQYEAKVYYGPLRDYVPGLDPEIAATPAVVGRSGTARLAPS